MKRFTPDAVKSRAIERIKKRADAATVIDDGGFSNLLDAISEGIAEVARYSEYNTLESKWNTANNISSLTVQGSLIGRKRERPMKDRKFRVFRNFGPEIMWFMKTTGLEFIRALKK